MARKPPRLAVVFTPFAVRDLNQIWDWNAKEFGVERAHAYVGFLRDSATQLGKMYFEARTVPGSEQFRYATVRRGDGRHSHSHILVFQLTASGLEVLRIFHSRQDWQGRLGAGEY